MISVSNKNKINPHLFVGLSEANQNRYIRAGIEVNPEQLIDLVSEFFSEKVEDVKSQTRTRALVNVRQVIMFLLSRNFKMPLKKIGGMMGGRDHSTVIYACTTVEDYLETDKLFKVTFCNCCVHTFGIIPENIQIILKKLKSKP